MELQSANYVFTLVDTIESKACWLIDAVMVLAQSLSAAVSDVEECFRFRHRRLLPHLVLTFSRAFRRNSELSNPSRTIASLAFPVRSTTTNLER